MKLQANPDLGAAREILRAYEPAGAQQVAVKEEMLAFVAAHPEDAHLRSCLQGHLTASVLLMDHARERVLLTLHRKLERWLQLGGHCDGDGNLAHVAWREAEEESGIEGVEMDLEVLDLDIHTIPEHKDVPQHLHLDARYIAYAPQGAREVISDESIDLRWYAFDELAALPGMDESLIRALGAARQRWDCS